MSSAPVTIEPIWSSKGSVYSSRILRWLLAPASSNSSSARRLLMPRKSAPSAVTTYSHGDIGTSIASAPAIARSTKPAAMTIRSMSTMCFSLYVYANISAL